MSTTTTPSDPAARYRVDRFSVPGAAREEFLERVRDAHALPRTLPGFVRDTVLERPVGPARSDVTTIVEWESEEAMAAVRGIVAERQRSDGFDPGALLRRLGIEADRADYRRIG